ncbi:Uncharacterized protein APZ42_021461 [Daphnia magna]|uniref:Uncharacterized protein n=1 Tax=Daphnia magna TaxID=35525 RepID=A0A164WN06_9CRUS|nr:Uncharacterized protein APZ42_021461 [Daphnia magna]
MKQTRTKFITYGLVYQPSQLPDKLFNNATNTLESSTQVLNVQENGASKTDQV